MSSASGNAALNDGVVTDITSTVDRWVVWRCYEFAAEHPAWVWWWKAVSFATGMSTTRLVGVAVAAFLLGAWAQSPATQRLRIALLTAASVIAVTWLAQPIEVSLKHHFGRARPQWMDPVSVVGGYSFPSGHATAAMVAGLVVAIVLAPWVPSHLRPWLYGIVALYVLGVATARLALAVHYPTDILAGWLLAAALCSPLVFARRFTADILSSHGTRPLRRRGSSS